MSPQSEDLVLTWLRRQPQASLFLGDDAATLPKDGPWAVTVDGQIAGVHVPPNLDPAVLARRLLAINLSDLAAMGATPAYAFVALAVPSDFDERRFFRAFLQACGRYRLSLAGGDLARSKLPTATLTLIGRKPPNGRWVRRSGARPGERLWIGGTPGEAAAGWHLVRRGARIEGNKTALPTDLKLLPSLERAAKRAVRRHLLPSPQIELGLWLGRQARGGAIDVSDGVARDLHRLCKESGVGCEVDLDALPFADRFAPLAEAMGQDPVELALAGGEDYVLVFTLPERVRPPKRLGCHAIGRITRPRTLHLIADGARRPLPKLGWDHFEQ